MIRILPVLLIFASLSINLFSQKQKLTYSQVFEYGMPRLTQSLPDITGWLDDKHYLELRRLDRATTIIYSVNAATGQEEVYLDYRAINEKLPRGFRAERHSAVTDNYSRFIFNESNDLYLYLNESNEFIQITKDDAEEENPTFSPDGNFIAFTKLGNLYLYDIENRALSQLTNDGSDVVYNGYASWVYYEEILERSSRYKAFWWSPDSRKIAFLRFDDSPVPVFPLFNCAGLHGELEIQRYPKAGDPNPLVKLGVADVDQKNVEWVADEPEGENYIAFPFFSIDGSNVYYQWANRAQNNIKIFSVDLETKNRSIVYDETQETWVEFFNDVYLLKDGTGFIIKSDRDGWFDLFYYDMQGNLTSKLTDNGWEVKDIAYVDEKNGVVYFHGTGVNSTEKHFFKVSLDGQNLTQLTKEKGTNSAKISPHGSYYINTFSSINDPGRMVLFNGIGDRVRKLADRITPDYENYQLAKGELFKIETADGIELPALWYLPPDFDEMKKYPVIFNVYGGPGRSSVTNSYPRGLSAFFYAQNGIILIEVDHRGSGHFGKEGAAKMHRQLGKWEVDDLIEAVKWLRKQPFIDGDKIGITGGSYGGYVAALALTRGSEYFNYAIPQLSVTDWRLYDNFYTERYMDTPEENPDGYNSSSVLNYVDDYRGGMYIIHSTMDNNVHMQNSMQLIGALQEKNKDFEMMIYPGDRHGIGYPKRFHLKKEEVKFWWKNLLNRDFNRNDY